MRLKQKYLATAALFGALPLPAAAQFADQPIRIPEREEAEQEAQEAEGPAEQRLSINNWGVTAALNYSDNPAQIQDGNYQRIFRNEEGDTLYQGNVFLPSTTPTFLPDVFPPVIVSPVSDIVPLEIAPPTTFGTLNFNGVTAVERARLRGIARGNLRIGRYFDVEQLSETNEEVVNSNLPFVALAQGLTPFVGDRNVRETFVDPNLSGFARYDLPGNFSLDGGAFATQQILFQGFQFLAQNGGQNFERATLGGVFLGPSYLAKLGADQTVEANYRHSNVFVIDEGGEDLTAFQRSLLSESSSDSGEITYGTGLLFDPFTVKLRGFARIIREEGQGGLRPDQDLDQLSFSAETEFRQSSRLAFLATVGYDDLEITSGATSAAPSPNDRSLSEPFFYGGIRYLPNRSSNLALQLGRRFGGTQVLLDASVEVTPRITVTSQVGREVTSGTQNLQTAQAFFNGFALRFLDQLQSGEDLLDNQLTDPTAQALFGDQQVDITRNNDINFSIQPLTRAQLGVVGNFGRNRLSLFGTAQIFDENDDESTFRFFGQGNRYNVNLSGSRRVNRRLSINASAFYSRLDFLGNEERTLPGFGANDINSVSYRAGLNYNFSRNWAFTASYQRIEQRVDNEPSTLSLVNGTIVAFEENQARVGVRLRF